MQFVNRNAHQTHGWLPNPDFVFSDLHIGSAPDRSIPSFHLEGREEGARATQHHRFHLAVCIVTTQPKENRAQLDPISAQPSQFSGDKFPLIEKHSPTAQIDRRLVAARQPLEL